MQADFAVHKGAASVIRDPLMDGVRGVALCGILFLNIFYFGLFRYGYLGQLNDSWDTILASFTRLFLDGRFRSLFCLLFGAGLWILLQRNNGRTDPLKTRLFWLCAFGALHGFLFFAGDILLTYGLAGLLVLGLLNSELHELRRYAMLFFLLAFSLNSLFMFVEPPGQVLFSDPQVQADVAVLSRGFWAGRLANAENFFAILPGIPLVTLWYTAALVLSGVYLFRRGWLVSPMPGRMLWPLVFAAAVFTAVTFYCDQTDNRLLFALREGLNWLAAFLMALVYCQLLCRVFIRRPVAILTLAGRYSLSIYLGQSLLMVVIFSVYGETIVRRFGYLDYWLLAAISLGLLLVIARLLSSRYGQGPVERLLRTLSR